MTNPPQDPFSKEPHDGDSAPSGGQQPPYGGQPPYGQSPYGGQPPYGGQSPYGGQPPYGGQDYSYGGNMSKNNLGLWSMVLGIVALLCCGLIAGIPAVILGNKSKQAVAAGLANNASMATAGIVMGWISIVFSVIALIIQLTTGFSVFASL